MGLCQYPGRCYVKQRVPKLSVYLAGPRGDPDASWAPQPPSSGMWSPNWFLLNLMHSGIKSLELSVALLRPVDKEGDKPVGGKLEK